MNNTRGLQILILIAVVWAFMVIALGAFTRLTDAGLGCPDWPGCYGHIAVPSVAEQHNVQSTKAWTEMVHRYFAGSLGILILLIVFFTAKQARRLHRRAWWVVLGFLLGLLIYQPLLGMWTVTLKLSPPVVSQHLLGGMSILGLLWLTYLMVRYQDASLGESIPKRVRVLAVVTLVLLFFQLALGAWTSTNYAAIVCPNFPFCTVHPWHYDFYHAFNVMDPIGRNYQGGLLSDNARRTIQMVHRLGALIVSLFVMALVVSLAVLQRNSTLQKLSFLLLALLFIQVGLGIANAVFARPLAVSVAHNLCAAALVVTLVTINYFSFRRVGS